MLFSTSSSPRRAMVPCSHRLLTLNLIILVLTTEKGWAKNRHTSGFEEEALALEDSKQCVCPIFDLPDLNEKAATARWMAHTLEWGVLSSISTRLTGSKPVPFGNVYSFVDGPCHNATGTPYLYGTSMDQSFADALSNPTVSLTLSEAAMSPLQTSCWKSQQSSAASFRACRVAPHVSGDPENPVCARLVLTGQFEILNANAPEFEWAKSAIFQRHPSMSDWPEDHNWQVAAIRVQDVWLLDYFGGATILKLSDYYNVDLKPPAPSATDPEVRERDDLH